MTTGNTKYIFFHYLVMSNSPHVAPNLYLLLFIYRYTYFLYISKVVAVQSTIRLRVLANCCNRFHSCTTIQLKACHCFMCAYVCASECCNHKKGCLHFSFSPTQGKRPWEIAYIYTLLIIIIVVLVVTFNCCSDDCCYCL